MYLHRKAQLATHDSSISASKLLCAIAHANTMIIPTRPKACSGSDLRPAHVSILTLRLKFMGMQAIQVEFQGIFPFRPNPKLWSKLKPPMPEE